MATKTTWKSIPLSHHPATLPKCSIPDSADHFAVAKDALQHLPQLDLRDLAENAIWRDSLAFTGTFRTFFGPEDVQGEWTSLSRKHKPEDFQIDDGSSLILRLDSETCWIQASFSFYTHGDQEGRCSGTIGLAPDSDTWKIWLLCTVMEQPHGFPDVDHLRPGPRTMPKGLSFCDSKSEIPPTTQNVGIGGNGLPDVDCLVVGAGVAGLCMAGRLKALDLSYVIVDKNDAVGDVWSKDRYDSIKLHTSKQYNQLPGLPATFDKDYPYLLGAEDISRGFQSFVDVFGINVMTSTMLEKAHYDESEKIWLAHLRRAGQDVKIRARHIVLAIGDMGVTPAMPHYAEQQSYKGDIVHACSWKNASPWRGKRGIVVGSANSAHDIIADMAEEDFESITMVQRSETFVLPLSTFSALTDPVYNEDTPIELSDRTLMSIPLSIQRLEAMVGIRVQADLDPAQFDLMEAHGFKTRRYGDLWGQLYETQGKHFFDVGAGDLIRSGRVEVQSNSLPVAYTESGLMLDNGDRIDADVIVFATGYSSHMKSTTRQIFGDEIAGNLPPFWGTDVEGEIFGAWKPTGCHGIWYTGHGFGHARYYSRFVAMQIRADVLGKPFRVYEANDLLHEQ